ncbi:hypothetical protein Pcinc_041699 [Petrolisthes cinctipes]|uniref:Uncharacterized protein n=1 Tax=Petrolisthes cinctipes TaxID=88211 RepID=A0AAE1EGN5_PETCI|nr:hypothetical protein Pcinc_041699 [Petrolisthes cinctipes]
MGKGVCGDRMGRDVGRCRRWCGAGGGGVGQEEVWGKGMEGGDTWFTGCRITDDRRAKQSQQLEGRNMCEEGFWDRSHQPLLSHAVPYPCPPLLINLSPTLPPLINPPPPSPAPTHLTSSRQTMRTMSGP